VDGGFPGAHEALAVLESLLPGHRDVMAREPFWAIVPRSAGPVAREDPLLSVGRFQGQRSGDTVLRQRPPAFRIPLDADTSSFGKRSIKQWPNEFANLQRQTKQRAIASCLDRLDGGVQAP
jgi:hypothetical protein